MWCKQLLMFSLAEDAQKTEEDKVIMALPKSRPLLDEDRAAKTTPRVLPITIILTVGSSDEEELLPSIIAFLTV